MTSSTTSALQLGVFPSTLTSSSVTAIKPVYFNLKFRQNKPYILTHNHRHDKLADKPFQSIDQLMGLIYHIYPHVTWRVHYLNDNKEAQGAYEYEYVPTQTGAAPDMFQKTNDSSETNNSVSVDMSKKISDHLQIIPDPKPLDLIKNMDVEMKDPAANPNPNTARKSVAKRKSSTTTSAITTSLSTTSSAITSSSTTPSSTKPKRVYTLSTKPRRGGKTVQATKSTAKSRTKSTTRSKTSTVAVQAIPKWFQTRENGKWNTVATLFQFCLFIRDRLKWPINFCYVTSSWETGGVQLTTAVYKIMTKYNLIHHYDSADPAVRLLVWCVASMNHLGEIRPIIFKIQTHSNSTIRPLLMYAQPYGSDIFTSTWSFGVNLQGLLINYDNTKIRLLPLSEFPLFASIRSRDIMESIPAWIYHMVK